jgi:hypothetical protein
MISSQFRLLLFGFGYFMSEAGCAGVVAGVIANIAIYIAVFGFELGYLGPLWILPGLIGGPIGGIVGNSLNRTNPWRGIIGGALGVAIGFGCMYFALMSL